MNRLLLPELPIVRKEGAGLTVFIITTKLRLGTCQMEQILHSIKAMQGGANLLKYPEISWLTHYSVS